MSWKRQNVHGAVPVTAATGCVGDMGQAPCSRSGELTDLVLLAPQTPDRFPPSLLVCEDCGICLSFGGKHKVG